MVCPDARRSAAPRWEVMERIACCVELAGVSPAAVIAGEPRSRLQSWCEITPAERSVESPVWERTVTIEPTGGKQSCGPSLKRTLQPREISPRKGGVAEPVMSRRRQQTASSRSGAMQDAPGVWRRARSDSSTRNRRGPPPRPPSGKDPTYKPSAKWKGAERESEGRVVPSMLGESREEGRGPALVALARGGKDEGMP